MPEQAAQPVTRVWITSGCIICGLCEDTCPEVFDVRESSAIIKNNAERHYEKRSLKIIQAATECPVSVIRVGGFNEPG